MMHKPVAGDQTECSVCGAVAQAGAWVDPRDHSRRVSDDCDDARRSLFPAPDTVRAPPDLTPDQIERLALLMEECGELVQAAGKILRHGYDSKYAGVDNKTALTREVGDVMVAINMMLQALDVDSADVVDRVKEKTESVKKYLHHQKG